MLFFEVCNRVLGVEGFYSNTKRPDSPQENIAKLSESIKLG